MSALAVRWLAGLVLTLFIAASSYWAGDHNRNNAWLAKQAVAERGAHQQYEAEVLRGGAAASSYIAAHQVMQGQFQQLSEKFNGLSKRVPLVVRPGGAACGVRSSTGEPQVEADSHIDDAGGLLTAAAVWMWNSALTGTDQPAGACGAVDTTTASCAVATGLTLIDAWANHGTNAQLCAEDRLAHQRLIDFLTPRRAPRKRLLNHLLTKYCCAWP